MIKHLNCFDINTYLSSCVARLRNGYSQEQKNLVVIYNTKRTVILFISQVCCYLWHCCYLCGNSKGLKLCIISWF